MIIEAILLGLSSGTFCTMYCGPVLVPFLFGAESESFKRNAGLTGLFLGARLAMYFVLGAVFAAAGLLVFEFFDPYLARRLSMAAYFFCGLFLLFNSFGVKFPWGKTGCKCAKLKHFGNDYVTAIFTGLSVGLHLCPALWTAIVRSFFGGMENHNIFYLVFFYIGTLPFYLPLLGVPFIKRRWQFFKNIARVSQFLIGFYFVFFEGLLRFFF